MSAPMKVVHIVAGAVVAAGLMWAAVALWERNLIIFGAPLAVASLAAVWVAIDNSFVYKSKRGAQGSAAAPDAGAARSEVEAAPDGYERTQ